MDAPIDATPKDTREADPGEDSSKCGGSFEDGERSARRRPWLLEDKTEAQGGAVSLSIDRLLETSHVASIGDVGGLRGPFKRIARMDYHHVSTGIFGRDERDDHFEVYYLPKEQAFAFGPEGQDEKSFVGILRTRAVCQAWARHLSMSWDQPEVTGDPSLDRQIIRQWRKDGSCRSMRIAAYMLMPKLQKVLAVAAPTALRIQRKAFSALGRVPKWAFVPDRLRERAEECGWSDLKYAVEDFLRMRWFRLALSSRSEYEHEKLQAKKEESGRVRKALAQVPGGISGKTMQEAISFLDVTPRPPSRRLTWLALSYAARKTSPAAKLATAIQRASTYELRKAFRRAREIRAFQSEELTEEDFYVHSEKSALRMISWLSDVNQSENEDLRCTSRTDLVNWAERSGRYHRDLARQRRERESREVLSANPFQTGLRPVSLPEGVEALTRPRELLKEAKRMNHCVDVYASEVAEGTSMIFHYETGGHHATIQLQKTGGDAWKIKQARGPDNAYNRATKEGKEKIRRWLEQNPEVKAPRFELGGASCPRDTTPKRKELCGRVRNGKGATAGSEDYSQNGGIERWTDRPNLEARSFEDRNGEICGKEIRPAQEEEENRPDLPF